MVLGEVEELALGKQISVRSIDLSDSVLPYDPIFQVDEQRSYIKPSKGLKTNIELLCARGYFRGNLAGDVVAAVYLGTQEIVGSAGFDIRNGLVILANRKVLKVDFKYQRNGIGQALMETALAYALQSASDEGIPVREAFVQTTTQNTPTRNICEKLGFKAESTPSPHILKYTKRF